MSVPARSAGDHWPVPRHDPQNTGRSPLTGRMTRAPSERWRMSTGGDVSFARAIRARDGEGVLVLAGSAPAADRQRTGSSAGVSALLGASYVEHLGDMDGTGTPCALVKTDARTLVLIDVASGEECWRWVAPPGTFVGDGAGFKVEEGPGGAALYLFPTYATDAWCFDFAFGRRTPALRWHRSDLPYDAGFGPSVVLADMDGDGRSELLLSSRTAPTTAATRRPARRPRPRSSSGVGTARCGRRSWIRRMGASSSRRGSKRCPAPRTTARGHTGCSELPRSNRTHCRAWCCRQLPGRGVRGRDTHRAAREAFAATTAGSWRRIGRPTSASCGRSRPPWRTCTATAGRCSSSDSGRTGPANARPGPARRPRGPIASLPGRYFWGCHDVDGDGRPEILTSRETHRTPRARSTLEAWRGRTSGASGRCRRRHPRVIELATCHPTSRSWRIGGMRSPSRSRQGERAFSFAARARTDRRSAPGPEQASNAPRLRAAAPGRIRSSRCCRGRDRLRGRRRPRRPGRLRWRPAAWRSPMSRGAWRRPSQGRPMAGGSSSIVPAARSSAGARSTGRDGVLDAAWSVAGTLPALDIDRDATSTLIVADGSDPRPPVSWQFTASRPVAFRPVGFECRRPCTSASSRSVPTAAMS